MQQNDIKFLTALGIMVYALITYHWRAAAIRRRDSGPYDDRLGPVSDIRLYIIALGSY